MDISIQQDSLQKQKIEGYQEYSNNLNDLTSKQFVQFFQTCTEVKPSMQDLKNFVKNEIKPIHALTDICRFFTKSGDRCLDVFAGEGTISTLLADMGREVVAIECDKEKVKSYEELAMSDAFLPDIPFLQKKADEGLMDVEGDFDFIILDPPLKGSKSIEDTRNLADMTLASYSSYIAWVIDTASSVLKADKFLVCLVQDFYKKGQYVFMPQLITDQVSNLEFKGLKIYHRVLETNCPQTKTYMPLINHFYALIFKKKP